MPGKRKEMDKSFLKDGKQRRKGLLLEINETQIIYHLEDCLYMFGP